MDREEVEDKLARERHAEIRQGLRDEQVLWGLVPAANAAGMKKEQLIHLAVAEGDRWMMDLAPGGSVKLRSVDDDPSPDAAESQLLSEFYAGVVAQVDHVLDTCGVGREFGLGCDADRNSPGAIADQERIRLGHSTKIADIERARQAEARRQQHELARQRTPAAFVEELRAGEMLMSEETAETIVKAVEAGDRATMERFLINLSVESGPGGERVHVAEVRAWHPREWTRLTTRQAQERLGAGGRQMSVADLYDLVASRERLRVRFGDRSDVPFLTEKRFIGPQELAVDGD